MVISIEQKITDVRSIIGGENDIEEFVTSVRCAVRICDVKSKPDQVRHDNDALSRTPRIRLFPFSFSATSYHNAEIWQRNEEFSKRF